MFHNILLLGCEKKNQDDEGIGKIVYQGTVDDAKTYFVSLGFQPEPDVNPADYYIDVIGGLKQSTRERQPNLFEEWERKQQEDNAQQEHNAQERDNDRQGNYEQEGENSRQGNYEQEEENSRQANTEQQEDNGQQEDDAQERDNDRPGDNEQEGRVNILQYSHHFSNR